MADKNLKEVLVIITVAFLTLFFGLWMVLIYPCVDIDVATVPASVNQSQSMFSLKNNTDLAVIQSAFFSALLLCGYLCNFSKHLRLQRIRNRPSSLKELEQEPAITRYNYGDFVFFLPWIATFATAWVKNIVVYITLVCNSDIFESEGALVFLVKYVFVLEVQQIVLTDVVCTIFHKWEVSKYNTYATMIWDQQKNLFLFSAFSRRSNENRT